MSAKPGPAMVREGRGILFRRRSRIPAAGNAASNLSNRPERRFGMQRHIDELFNRGLLTLGLPDGL